MGKNKPKPHLTKNIIRQTLDQQKRAKDLYSDDYCVFSFRHFDRTQGSSFADWQKEGTLAVAVEVMVGLCNNTIQTQFNSSKYTIYKRFPPRDKTTFSHPQYIPEDACWARIHVNGKHCIIGHIIRNIFYVVFLDSEHKFWKSEC